MRKYGVIGCFAALGFVLMLSLIDSAQIEPVYAGKTVSEWLEAGNEDATMALHEIGPPAAPYILAKLRREDPQHGSFQRYHDFWQNTHSALRRFLPKPKPANFDELRACGALLELGPLTVPMLTTGLHDSNPVVREVSAHALGSLRELGKNISVAAPFLNEARRDPNLRVRARAKWALEGNLQAMANPDS
jgi:hypothetical protein